MGDVDRDDLRELHTTMREGFAGVHRRLDTLNGRVGKGEVELARHDSRIASVERAVYQRRADDDHDDEACPYVPRPQGDRAPITRRDVQVAGYVLSAAAGAILFVWQLLPALWTALVKALTP